MMCCWGLNKLKRPMPKRKKRPQKDRKTILGLSILESRLKKTAIRKLETADPIQTTFWGIKKNEPAKTPAMKAKIRHKKT